MKTSLILIAVSLTLGAMYTQPAVFVILLPFVAFVALRLLVPSKTGVRAVAAVPLLSKADVPGLLLALFFAPPFLIMAGFMVFYLCLVCVTKVDATTFAIAIPSAVLVGLLSAAALKKGLMPNPLSALSVCFLGLALNLVVFKFHWMNCYWGDAASLQTDFMSRVYAHAWSLSFNSVLNFLTVFPIVFCANLFLFRNNPRFARSSKVYISLAASLITCTIIFSFLPITWIYLSGHPFGQIPFEVECIAVRSLQLTMSFSTVGVSIAGFLIAISGTTEPSLEAARPRPEHIPQLPLKPVHTLLLIGIFITAFIVVHVQSNLPLLHVVRGVFCTSAGRYNDALTAFDEALRLKPSYGGAYQVRAYTLTKLRRVDEAVEDLGHAVDLDSKLSHEHFLRVMDACFEAKRSELVVSHCDKLLRKKPSDRDALRYRGLAFTRLGDQKRARKDCDQLVFSEPNDAYAYLHRSQMFKRFGQSEHAFSDASIAISKRPDIYWAYEIRGSILMDLDCPQFALNDLNKAIELCPKGGTAHFTRSKIEAALGMTAESQRDLAIAIERKRCVEQGDFYKE